MMYINFFTNGGWAGGRPGAGGFSFLDILIYYFIYVIIKTLYISSFIVFYVIYFTHSLYCYLMMCISLLKNALLAARKETCPTDYDLDG